MPISPLIYFTSAQLFYFLALVVKPSPYRRLFMVPILLSVICYLHGVQQNRHVLSLLAIPVLVRYSKHQQWCLTFIILAQLCKASDYILLTDVQRELFKKGQKVPAYRLPLYERIKWAASLFMSVRCIGWSHEPTRALPPRCSPSTAPRQFILQGFGYLALELAPFAMAMVYIKHSPSLAANGYSMAADGNVRLTMNIFALVIFIITYEWVPLFGNPVNAYTLRRTWGYVWHQMLRRVGISHGRFIAQDVLGLERKSKASLQVQIYVAFAMSGIIHLADNTMIGKWEHHALKFFLLEAVGITIEGIVLEVARKLSIPKWRLWKGIGYLWVLGWLMYTIPIRFDPLFRAGAFEIWSDVDAALNWLRARVV